MLVVYQFARRKMPSGYSGTPLSKKLGLKESSHLHLINAPDDYESLLGELPPGLVLDQKLSRSTTIIHLFVMQRSHLTSQLGKLRKTIAAEATVWVSWPKKASKVTTDVTEDTIREVALPLGFVDIKVCAVSEVWSGLKLMIRKELRAPANIKRYP
jgi:hypothetical protein